MNYCKRILTVLCLALMANIAVAQPYPDAQHPVHVKEYVKKNGVVVKEHWRTKPTAKKRK